MYLFYDSWNDETPTMKPGRHSNIVFIIARDIVFVIDIRFFVLIFSLYELTLIADSFLYLFCLTDDRNIIIAGDCRVVPPIIIASNHWILAQMAPPAAGLAPVPLTLFQSNSIKIWNALV